MNHLRALPETALPETALPETALPETALAETALPERALPDPTPPETALSEAPLPETASSGRASSGRTGSGTRRSGTSLADEALADRGLPRQPRGFDDRPAVSVVARIAPEHDHEDIAELLELAARFAAVRLHLEFAGPDPAGPDPAELAPGRGFDVGSDRGSDAGPDLDLPALLRCAPDEAVRVRVLVPGRVVLRDGERVHLSRLEFDLLRFLAERPGRVFSREALLDAVWGGDREVTPRTVDVHVRRVRAKLGRDLQLLSTVRGVGYRLDPGQLRIEQRSW